MKHLSQIQCEFIKEAAVFPSQEALNKYLKEHPGSDKSRHKVLKKIKYRSEWGKKYAQKDFGRFVRNTDKLIAKAKSDINSVTYKQLFTAWESFGSVKLSLKDIEGLNDKEKRLLSREADEYRKQLDKLMEKYPIEKTHL